LSAPISAEGRAQLRRIREAELRGGRGVGGEAWVVTRADGEGVGAPVDAALVGTAAALVGERPAGRQASAAPGASVAETTWEAIIVGAAPALLPDDVLTSATAPALAFRLRSVTDRRLHETWDVTPTKPGADH
jgi:hypothetical protein